MYCGRHYRPLQTLTFFNVATSYWIFRYVFFFVNILKNNIFNPPNQKPTSDFFSIHPRIIVTNYFDNYSRKFFVKSLLFWKMERTERQLKRSFKNLQDFIFNAKISYIFYWRIFKTIHRWNHAGGLKLTK